MSNLWKFTEHHEEELTPTLKNTKRLELDGLTIGYIFTDRMEFLSELPGLVNVCRNILALMDNDDLVSDSGNPQDTNDQIFENKEALRALLAKYKEE